MHKYVWRDDISRQTSAYSTAAIRIHHNRHFAQSVDLHGRTFIARMHRVCAARLKIVYIVTACI